MEILNKVYYDETSETFLRWKEGTGLARKENYVAGHLCETSGYSFVTYENKRFPVHNIVWVIFNGEISDGMIVDHVDCIRNNNSISNLRLATISQNNMNKGVRSDSSTGTKGLSWHISENRWYGSVTVDGKRVYKKSKDREVVEKWLSKFRDEVHGDFSRS